MPCVDGREGMAAAEENELRFATVRAACDMAKVLRRAPELMKFLSPKTIQWILEHEERDALREGQCDR